MDDLSLAEDLCDDLGEIFCLTLIRDTDEAETLRLLGGLSDTVKVRTLSESGELQQSFEAGLPQVGMAVPLAGWSAVIEIGGFTGADVPVLSAASRGTEAITVLRHAYAASKFYYAVNGELITGFEPGHPVPGHMIGADPERLRDLMNQVGLRKADDDDEDDVDDVWEYAVARSILLAQRIAGVSMPPQPLDPPRLSAHLERWFVAPVSGNDAMRIGALFPGSAQFASIAKAAPEPVQRAVAAAELRRHAANLGVLDSPGLVELLAAAEHQAAPPITADSPLGQCVRDWLAAQRRAAAAVNVPYRGQVTESEIVHWNYLGGFAAALRGASSRDPSLAILSALVPIASGVEMCGTDVERQAVVRALRGEIPPGTY